MAERDDRRRRAPGSRPTIKVFLPFAALGVVLVAAFVWIYVLGPTGDMDDRGNLLHLQEEQELDVGAGADVETEDQPDWSRE